MTFKDKVRDSLDKLKSSKKIQIYLGVTSVVIIVIVGGFIIFNNSKNEMTPTLQTYTIPENEKIFINGVIVPKQSREIPGPSNGSTPDIRVTNGQNVKSGDVLYIVKDEAAIQEISSIKTQISNLIKEKRALKPDDTSLVAINSQLASLNSNLSAANAKAYTKVKAPFDGRVYINSHASSGSGDNNAALMTVQSTEYVMNGQISEQDLNKVKNDMTADVTVLSSGDTVKGRVSYISERPLASGGEQGGDSASSLSLYNIVMTFDTQEGLVDGYHTQATIEVNTDKYKVPTKSIVNDGSEIYVFIEVDGHLRKVNVEILSDSEDYSMVSGDLNENDIIVKNPTKKMKDGDPFHYDSSTK
nr:HlyD family efflux transporter periplasmic adaptor subunit [uncultured Peptostreptococcus sp.]